MWLLSGAARLQNIAITAESSIGQHCAANRHLNFPQTPQTHHASNMLSEDYWCVWKRVSEKCGRGRKILSLLSIIKCISRGLHNKRNLLSHVTKWYKRRISFVWGLIQPKDHLSALPPIALTSSKVNTPSGHKMAASSSQSQNLPLSCPKGDGRSSS